MLKTIIIVNAEIQRGSLAEGNTKVLFLETTTVLYSSRGSLSFSLTTPMLHFFCQLLPLLYFVILLHLLLSNLFFYDVVIRFFFLFSFFLFPFFSIYQKLLSWRAFFFFLTTLLTLRQWARTFPFSAIRFSFLSHIRTYTNRACPCCSFFFFCHLSLSPPYPSPRLLSSG